VIVILRAQARARNTPRNWLQDFYRPVAIPSGAF